MRPLSTLLTTGYMIKHTIVNCEWREAGVFLNEEIISAQVSAPFQHKWICITPSIMGPMMPLKDNKRGKRRVRRQKMRQCFVFVLNRRIDFFLRAYNQSYKRWEASSWALCRGHGAGSFHYIYLSVLSCLSVLSWMNDPWTLTHILSKWFTCSWSDRSLIQKLRSLVLCLNCTRALW